MTLRSVPACLALLLVWAAAPSAAAPSEASDAATAAVFLAEGVLAWGQGADSADDAEGLVLLVYAVTESGDVDVLGFVPPHPLGHRVPVGKLLDPGSFPAIRTSGESSQMACVGIDLEDLSVENRCTIKDITDEGQEMLS